MYKCVCVKGKNEKNWYDRAQNEMTGDQMKWITASKQLKNLTYIR